MDPTVLAAIVGAVAGVLGGAVGGAISLLGTLIQQKARAEAEHQRWERRQRAEESQELRACISAAIANLSALAGIVDTIVVDHDGTPSPVERDKDRLLRHHERAQKALGSVIAFLGPNAGHVLENALNNFMHFPYTKDYARDLSRVLVEAVQKNPRLLNVFGGEAPR
jgi:hypothetical protein